MFVIMMIDDRRQKYNLKCNKLIIVMTYKYLRFKL